MVIVVKFLVVITDGRGKKRLKMDGCGGCNNSGGLPSKADVGVSHLDTNTLPNSS